MNGYKTHRSDRSGLTALAGLLVAVLVAAAATIPAQWFIASLILVVLAMPVFLVIEPALERVPRKADLPPS